MAAEANNRSDEARSTLMLRSARPQQRQKRIAVGEATTRPGADPGQRCQGADRGQRGQVEVESGLRLATPRPGQKRIAVSEATTRPGVDYSCRGPHCNNTTMPGEDRNQRGHDDARSGARPTRPWRG